MRKIITVSSVLLLLAATPAAGTNYLDRSAWSWKASSTSVADGDITGIGGICDDNVNTCWHSNWHAAAGSPERSNPHWVMIDRGTDRTKFNGLAYIPRQSSVNQACTSYYIYLSDTDMSSTPASSADDIISALGAPDASGSWEGTSAEKFATFDKESDARYILFVNLTSLNSSSAACAEMNLFSGTGGGSTTNAYNAIRITPADGSTPHRIAIKGTELTMSMSYGYIRMSNSDITIEYDPTEVGRFNFERYTFDADASYTGTKKDVLSETFGLNVTPAAGQLTELTDITISPAGGMTTRLNPAVTESIRLTGGDTIVREVTPDGIAAIASGTDYILSAVNATAPGTYTLTIPAGLLIEPDGARSEAIDMSWTINTGQDTIEELDADCPTLTISHSGGNLIVGGITDASEVALVNTAGITVMTAPVSSGTATLPVAGLAKGVYLLSINQTTLKIIL